MSFTVSIDRDRCLTTVVARSNSSAVSTNSCTRNGLRRAVTALLAFTLAFGEP
jgi:hypothetical protein